jgi:hypothetical protein
MHKLVQLLYTALEHDPGIAIHTDNIKDLSKRIYVQRRRQQQKGNNDLDGLSIFEMPDKNELWIINRKHFQDWREQNDIE